MKMIVNVRTVSLGENWTLYRRVVVVTVGGGVASLDINIEKLRRRVEFEYLGARVDWKF